MKNKITMSLTILLSIYTINAQWESDKWLKNPVGDEVFSSFIDFMKYDQSLDFDFDIIETKKEDGIKIEHISFLSTPNQKVTAYFTTSMIGKISNKPTLIMLHGGGKKGKDGMVKISKLYARQKINILSIDMQYFGERKTDLIIDFTEKEKHDKLYNQESQYLSFVTQTVKDVGRSFDLLVNQYKIDKININHYDLFRLKSSLETENLDLFGDRSSTITLIEWPQIIKEKPKNLIELFFEYEKNHQTRSIQIKGLNL